MKPNLIKSNIKLTIGMLVSNHIETIRKCMESIKPLLLAVPSELVVIDTVGEETDGSIEVVRKYTDKIYRFVWCNDFAAARNCCLDHAKGEWFLYLDDDEWFDDVQEFIDFFQSGESEHYRSGYYYTRDYSADGSYSMGIAGRMVRRTVNTKFVRKVHETFNEVFAPNKLFSCFTHHYGYAFADEASKKRHQIRNVSLLKEELQTEGYTPKVCAQMVQELLYLPETREEGGRFCMESIERLRTAEQMEDSCSQWLLLASIRFYFSEEKYKEAIKQAEEICSRYKVTQMAKLGISWVAVCSAVFDQNYPMVEKWVVVYLECYKWLKQHPEEALLQTQMDMPKYYSEKEKVDILQAGIAVANMMGKFEQAFEYLKQLPWKEYEEGKAEWFDGSKYREDLLATLRGLQDKSHLISYYQRFYKEEWFLPEHKDYLPKECREVMPLLSVSLLVSNRKDTIRKCMESLKPLLAAVPSELIAVDTVGEENSDGSLAIVREYTDHIVHFDWCNDFAAARNAGLKRARGEWFLYLDDDEWFEDTTPIIKFFLEGEYKQYDRAWYIVRNYKDWGGTEYAEVFVGRMCRITPQTHFEGRIHEGLVQSLSRVKYFSCYVHHYGYVYHNEEEKKKHGERNTVLLEEEMKAHPDDLYVIAHLVQEYWATERLEEAETLCRQTLKKYDALRCKNLSVQYFVVMLFRIIAEWEDKDAAISRFDEIETEDLYEVPKLICITEYIIVERQRENYSKVLKLIAEWLNLKEQIRVLGDRAIMQARFDFQQFLSSEWEKKIIRQGISALLQGEDYAIAQMLLERVPWSDEQNRPFEEMVCLTKLYGKSKKSELFFPYAEKIIKNPEMKEPFFVSLQDLVRDYPECREEISGWLQKFERKKQQKAINPELIKLAGQLKQNIRELVKIGKKGEAKELLDGLMELMPEDAEIKELEQLVVSS